MRLAHDRLHLLLGSCVCVFLLLLFFKTAPQRSHPTVAVYRYGETMLDKGTGKKGWIERGVGEMKILK